MGRSKKNVMRSKQANSEACMNEGGYNNASFKEAGNPGAEDAGMHGVHPSHAGFKMGGGKGK